MSLKYVDSICNAYGIVSFAVSTENDVLFFLKGQSNFFSGQIVERKLYYSPSKRLYYISEDNQIVNKCNEKITNKTLYIENIISN